ncbi:CoA-transferase family III [Hesseltinella vesiculosa]|uniref:CoA-transferase family III n=1 Tax=Hesseltinella vesiculosa TaxID=101127 RepID=A0A1X2G245_9FUNG|nr:CoA-transferase family III [Hesseltinella vesiculosa]
MGTAHPSIVPYQVFPTKDSFMMIGAGNDGQFAKFCQRVGLQDLVDDARFKTNADRVQHRQELIQLIEDELTQQGTQYWLDQLQRRWTFDHPQIKARGLVHEVDHPRAGKIKMVGPSYKFSGFKPSVRLPPPTLGAHTNEVLETVLGYDKQHIESLRSDGAIGK